MDKRNFKVSALWPTCLTLILLMAPAWAKPFFALLSQKEISRYISWAIDHKRPRRGGINFPYLKYLPAHKPHHPPVVGVIDTGLDPTHPFFKNNLYFPGKAAFPQTIRAGLHNFLWSRAKPFDDHGHGTHVSGIIKSILPNVKIFPLKYYQASASGEENLVNTLKALESAIEHKVDIINYSGGGPESSNREYRLLKRAFRAGILVVAAAGNENSDIDKKLQGYYPASYNLPNIITVMGHDEEGEKLPSSNWGAQSVDISAPGQEIRSALPRQRAGYMTGTSQATAFVTGMAAFLKAQYPKLSYKQIKALILTSAKKTKALKGLSRTGGILDSKRAFQMASKKFK